MSDIKIDAHSSADGDALLTLAGEVDLSHVDLLWDAASDALGTRPDRLVVEMSAVTFLNSSILGTLIRIQRAAGEQGTAFVLRRPSPLVLRLLRLSGLEGQMEVEA